MIKDLIELLHRDNLSCVIRNGSEIRTFHQRGVMDLYSLYLNDRDFLNGAMLADKIIGKGAAAIIALGKVAEVYTDVISNPAMTLLSNANITVTAKTIVPNIINRDKTGFCPLETKCAHEDDIEKILPLITDFINQMKRS